MVWVGVCARLQGTSDECLTTQTRRRPFFLVNGMSSAPLLSTCPATPSAHIIDPCERRAFQFFLSFVQKYFFRTPSGERRARDATWPGTGRLLAVKHCELAR